MAGSAWLQPGVRALSLVLPGARASGSYRPRGPGAPMCPRGHRDSVSMCGGAGSAPALVREAGRCRQPGPGPPAPASAHAWLMAHSVQARCTAQHGHRSRTALCGLAAHSWQAGAELLDDVPGRSERGVGLLGRLQPGAARTPWSAPGRSGRGGREPAGGRGCRQPGSRRAGHGAQAHLLSLRLGR